MIKKVVIIDDNQTQLRIVKNCFQNDGWEVFDTTNASDAIRLIFCNAPDLIVTDALMPNVGGFQLLKQIRENALFSKLPIIVYSVLKEDHAKFYLKKDNPEYFLTKDDNKEELLDLANEILRKNPISENYKRNILDNNIYQTKLEQAFAIPTSIEEEEEKEPQIIEEPFKIDKEALLSDIKKDYVSLMDDNKIANELFKIINSYLNYDFAVLSLFNFNSQQNILYLDIRNFILNPILQSEISQKYNIKNIVLNKKYSANSKTISSINEFNSKIEFSFEYLDKNISNISFYSQKQDLWDNEEEINKLKDILENLFKSRFISKSSNNTVDENLTNKYLNKIDISLKNKFNPSSTKIGMFLGVASIINYLDIEMQNEDEEMDYLNSKIVEKIINTLEKNEQIYKTDEDEYTIVLFADNKEEALMKFNKIFSMISLITIDDIKLDVAIGISNCYIDNIFDIYEAQKQAHIALDNTNKDEKVKVYEK